MNFRSVVFGMGMQAAVAGTLSLWGMIDLCAGQQLIAAGIFFIISAGLVVYAAKHPNQEVS